ncbi:hypothetical protein BDE02_01G179500 [Populus trichocarpa]|nr:hypothetical protein BDE02_01G179500 [Populus trichocarpa]
MSTGMETIRERLLRLEGWMGEIPDEEDRSVQDRLELAMEIAKKAVEQYVELAAEMSRKLQAVNAELAVLKQAVAAASGGAGSFKPKVPEPKPFDGVWSSKELENFLWDMKQYFSVAKIRLAEQVNIAVMSKEDLNAGRPKVETWEILKRELKEQFLSNNTS